VRLQALSPVNYIGLAEKIVEKFLDEGRMTKGE
jgi:hypothetical protein